MASVPGSRARPRVFYGWWIALAYLVMNLYWGGTLLAGFSALFTPIRDAFGFSSTMTTTAIQLRQGSAVVVAPLVGYLFDRAGPRALMLLATVTAAGGMALLAFADSATLFFLSFGIASIGFGVFIAGTGPAAMALWFVRHRGKAMSIILAGSTLGAFLVPAVVFLEESLGWRQTVLVIVGGLLATGIPASLVLRHRPEQYGLRPDGDAGPPLARSSTQGPGSGVQGPGSSPGPTTLDPRPSGVPASSPSRGPEVDFTFGEALRTRAFWLLSIGHLANGLGSGAVMLLIFPHLEDQGFSRATAALAVSIMGALGLAGAVILGWLSDYLERRYLIMLSQALLGGSLVALAFATSAWVLAPFVLMFGIGGRAALPIVLALQADYFGRAHFGKIQGLQLSGFMLGTTLGPIAGAVVRDNTGEYAPSFLGFAGLSLLSILAVSLVRRPAPVMGPESGVRRPVERLEPGPRTLDP